MGEQVSRKNAEHPAFIIVCAINYIAEHFGRAFRPAVLCHFLVHDRAIPLCVSLNEEEASRNPRREQQERYQRFLPHPAHSLWPAICKEIRQPFSRPCSHPINEKIGAGGQGFEIGDHGPIKRGFSRDCQ